MEVLNFDKYKDVVAKLKEMTGHGPDVGIDAGWNLPLCFVAHFIQETVQADVEECCSWMPLHQELGAPAGDCNGGGNRLRRRDQ